MDVRDFPPEKLCDLCRARIAKMTIRDELTLLKALCATCEGAVAGADRPENAIGWTMENGRNFRWILRS